MKSLIPFSVTAKAKSITIEVHHQQTSATSLKLDFVLKGALNLIQWPTPASPARKDKLWEHTCLEAFYRTSGSESAYTEINCSPAGAWNAYKFDSYRHGMRPGLAIQVKLVSSNLHNTEARFSIEIQDSDGIKLTALGLTAVIEFTDGEISYWALTHPAKDADFHDAQAWTALSTQ